MFLYILGEVARLVAAMTLVMSAAWKLTRRQQYRIAMEAGLERLPSQIRAPVVLALPYIELLIAVSAALAWPGAVLSMIAVIVFLAIVSLRFLGLGGQSLDGGCGCWRPVPVEDSGPKAHLLRNAILITLSAFAAAEPYQIPTIGVVSVALPAGLLFAWLVMELPAIMATLAAIRQGFQGAGA